MILKAVNWQLGLMMAWPIVVTLAVAVDEQLANAVDL
jgi:hypothetical protein